MKFRDMERILIKVDLTLAERLTPRQLEKAELPKETKGMVVIEKSIIVSEAKAEMERIIKSYIESGFDEAFEEYLKCLELSMRSCFKDD